MAEYQQGVCTYSIVLNSKAIDSLDMFIIIMNLYSIFFYCMACQKCLIIDVSHIRSNYRPSACFYN